MPTVRRAHFSFIEANGFLAGETRNKKLFLPVRAAGSYRETVVTASASPFNAGGENRQLRVTTLSVKSENPNPNTGDLPTVRVQVESIGPDAPQLWYLNLSFTEP